MIVKNIFVKFISRKYHYYLFKAGIYLSAAAMISLSQLLPFLYDKDLATYKMVFSVEAATGKSVNQATDCSKFDATLVVDCKMALHELRMLNSGNALLLMFFKWSWGVGCFLLGLSVVGFMIDVVIKSSEPQLEGVSEKAH